jgi:hypothetical protein
LSGNPAFSGNCDKPGWRFIPIKSGIGPGMTAFDKAVRKKALVEKKDDYDNRFAAVH